MQNRRAREAIVGKLKNFVSVVLGTKIMRVFNGSSNISNSTVLKNLVKYFVRVWLKFAAFWLAMGWGLGENMKNESKMAPCPLKSEKPSKR